MFAQIFSPVVLISNVCANICTCGIDKSNVCTNIFYLWYWYQMCAQMFSPLLLISNICANIFTSGIDIKCLHKYFYLWYWYKMFAQMFSPLVEWKWGRRWHWLPQTWTCSRFKSCQNIQSGFAQGKILMQNILWDLALNTNKQRKRKQTNKQTNKCKTSRGTWRTAAFPPILRLPCPDRASLKRGDCWQESGIHHLCSRWGLRANCLSRSREGSSWRGFCQVGEIRSDYVQTTWNRQLKIPPEIVSWESDVAKGSS